MKKEDIQLSVIIPVYNGKKYLKKILTSFENLVKCGIALEILLIDDGSTDGSGSYCRELGNSLKYIRVYEKENGGIADTRNYGLEKAEGKYVCFVDQDDDIHPDVLKRALQKSEAIEVECCIWGTQQVFENGKVIDNLCYSEEKFYNESQIKQALLDQYLRKDFKDRLFWIPGQVWSGMYRRDFLLENQIHFFSFIDFEDDCIFMNQVMRHCGKLLILTEVGYYWSCNLRSESHRLKYIENYWDKSEKLTAWFQDSVYDLFGEWEPPVRKLRKEKAIEIYKYIENLCNIENPAPISEKQRELKHFFTETEYVELLQTEEKPYGEQGKRRKIVRWLVLRKRYKAVVIFLKKIL